MGSSPLGNLGVSSFPLDCQVEMSGFAADLLESFLFVRFTRRSLFGRKGGLRFRLGPALASQFDLRFSRGVAVHLFATIAAFGFLAAAILFVFGFAGYGFISGPATRCFG